MKKLIIIILSAALLLTAAACGNTQPEITPAATEGTEAVIIAMPQCLQDGCENDSVSEEITYCRNHAGVCGICEEYIAPGKEYCSLCTYNLGLPVDDPSFVPPGSGFTNRYGTQNTICNHQGCTNKIANSGDTNCCTTHSNRCGNCNCYIDEDALFCMKCIEEAIG